MSKHITDKPLTQRAAAARLAIKRDRANPELTLSYVVWPTLRISQAQAA